LVSRPPNFAKTTRLPQIAAPMSMRGRSIIALRLRS
jgi:hypothetical protein